MSTADVQVDDREAMKAEWLGRLEDLVSHVKGWVEAEGWRTRTTTKPVSEPDLGTYEVPLLLLERGDVEVVLSPIARAWPGADGVVDLYLMPGYDDIASLYFQGGQWSIHYGFPPETDGARSRIEADRLPLDGAAISRVLDAIASHA